MPRNISSATSSSSSPPAIDSESTDTSRYSRTALPPSAKPMINAPAARTARSAICRRCLLDSGAVVAMKIGATPTGSMITVRVTNVVPIASHCTGRTLRAQAGDQIVDLDRWDTPAIRQRDLLCGADRMADRCDRLVAGCLLGQRQDLVHGRA